MAVGPKSGVLSQPHICSEGHIAIWLWIELYGFGCSYMALDIAMAFVGARPMSTGAARRQARPDVVVLSGMFYLCDCLHNSDMSFTQRHVGLMVK